MIEHNFKKKFGQNFISDKNLLNAICTDAGLSEADQVLEIGAGGGSLTGAISSHVKRVVSYEIDKDLQSHLLSLGLKNVEFVFGDIMNYSLSEVENAFEGSYKMVANLPYYITTPIIFKFIKSKKLDSLTIMVQKEVAQRMVAGVGSKDYGILSVMVSFYGNAQIKRIVPRNLFYPQPNVDSAIVNIKIDRTKFFSINDEEFYKFVGYAFSMRRKTLRNNLSHNGISKENLAKLDEKVLSKRAEEFDILQLIEIYSKIIGSKDKFLL